MCTITNSHFKTFDGLTYKFQGTCDYILSKDTNNGYAVILENVPCIKSSSNVFNSCGKNLKLAAAGGSSIELLQEKVTKYNGKVVKLPFSMDGLVIKEVSSQFVMVQVVTGLTVYYDGHRRILIHLSANHVYGDIQGLCGSQDGNQRNDMTTPQGALEGNAVIFANSWKSKQCVDDKQIEDGCNVNVQRVKEAKLKCSVLSKAPFSACHGAVDPEAYIDDCEEEVCGCPPGEKCHCHAVHRYLAICANKGIMIRLTNTTECGK